MTTTQATKATFCKSVLAGLDLTWYDLTGTKAVSHDRVVRVELVSPRISGTYTGFRVQLIHMVNGPIDSKVFAFDDYMKATGTASNSGNGLCVVDHCGWRWYLAEPKSTKPMVDAIRGYLAAFEATP